jgi:Tfp pilus assembly protein PilN
MHTIDLLRGQGIPAKTTLGSVIMIIVMVAVPILVGAWMVDRYIQNETEIGIKQQAIDKEQATIDELADAVKFKEEVLNQQKTVRSKLLEVSSCLGRYIQWSPVLMTLAKNMPRGMVMNSLSAESRIERPRVAGEKNPKSIVKRTLVIDISGTERRDYNDDIERYSNRLKSSSELGPKLEKIEFAQKPGTSGDINTVSYTMNLMFKSGTI